MAHPSNFRPHVFSALVHSSFSVFLRSLSLKQIMRNAFTKALFFSGQGNVERWTLHRDVEFSMATFFNTTQLYSIMFWMILNRFQSPKGEQNGRHFSLFFTWARKPNNSRLRLSNSEHLTNEVLHGFLFYYCYYYLHAQICYVG